MPFKNVSISLSVTTMNVPAFSSLLVSLVTLAIGTSVLLRDRTRRTYTSFAAFTFMVSAWHLCTFVASSTSRDTVQSLAEWLSYFPAATIPPTAVAFFREFLAQPSIGATHRPPRFTLAWTLLSYIVLIYAALSGIAIYQSLWFQVPFGIYVFTVLYRCVLDLYLQYRNTKKRVERTRILYLMVGGFVTVTLAATDALPRFGIGWPTTGNVLSTLYLYFLSQTLFRYRLIDLNELVGKMAVLGTLVVLLWATYGLLLTWVGGGQEGLFLLNAVVASFVILVLFEPVRTRLESTVNRWLVRQKNELRGHLEQLLRDLVGVVDVSQMTALIMQAMDESRRVTHASLFLLDSTATGFDRAGFIGEPPEDRIDATAHKQTIEQLREDFIDKQSLVIASAIRVSSENTQDVDHDRKQFVLSHIDVLHADLLFPMFGSAETEQGPWLLGILAVGDDRTGGEFDLDDIDMFRKLAMQGARTVEASQVYERTKERERLAAIGEMSAGLAHEIRNPLGAIKGAAQLLVGPDGQPMESGPEAKDFLNIIVEEVDRLNNVVSQFLDYARLERGDSIEHGSIDINEVVKKTIQLLDNHEDRGDVKIHMRLDELIPPVAGDPEALRQVMINLGLNAFHAMKTGGNLEIITTRRRRSRLGYGSFAEIRFRDTGVGISRGQIKKLFIPFFTTKSKGTGLGLAISQRIINQHGGTIEVRSVPGKSTTFSIFLPALGPSLPYGAVPGSITKTGRHAGRNNSAQRPAKTAVKPIAVTSAHKTAKSLGPHPTPIADSNQTN